VDMERAIETQRLRLLRLVAGLFVALGFLSVGPVSRGFLVWVCGFVDSVLSRAEVAARYLMIAQAKQMGGEVDRGRLSEIFTHDFDRPETGISVADCRARLRALKAVLTDLPRHALRLLRRITNQSQREVSADQPLPRPGEWLIERLQNWRLARIRIERPPDQIERPFDQAQTAL